MPLKHNFYKKQPEALYCAAGCFCLYVCFIKLESICCLYVKAAALAFAGVAAHIKVKAPWAGGRGLVVKANFCHYAAALQALRGCFKPLCRHISVAIKFIFISKTIISAELVFLIAGNACANAQAVAVNAVKFKFVISNLKAVTFGIGVEELTIYIKVTAFAQAYDFANANVRTVVSTFTFIAVKIACTVAQSVIHIAL